MTWETITDLWFVYALVIGSIIALLFAYIRKKRV